MAKRQRDAGSGADQLCDGASPARRRANGSGQSTARRSGNAVGRNCWPKPRPRRRSRHGSMPCRSCTTAMPGFAVRWLQRRDRGDRQSEALLRINLQRARFLPATAAMCWSTPPRSSSTCMRMARWSTGCGSWSASRIQPTPMMAAMIRFTAVNPYWNVPPDLAAERIAPNVRQGRARLSEDRAMSCCPTGARRRSRSIPPTSTGKRSRRAGCRFACARIPARPMPWGG